MFEIIRKLYFTPGYLFHEHLLVAASDVQIGCETKPVASELCGASSIVVRKMPCNPETRWS